MNVIGYVKHISFPVERHLFLWGWGVCESMISIDRKVDWNKRNE